MGHKLTRVGLFFVVLTIAGFLRFYKLAGVVGLDHDEALICLGAQQILQGTYQLTGDKVYEGPLLEYALALAFWLKGSTVHTARLVMALSGMAAVIGLFGVGYRLLGYNAGLSAMFFAAVSPWCLMTSRIIYICNTVPLLIVGAALSALLAQGTRKWLLIPSCAMIGLAMHGHLFTVILLLPLGYLVSDQLALRRSSKDRILVYGSLGALLTAYAPVLIYNIQNGFPALKIFLGSERHAPTLAAGITGIVGRIAGYLFTVIHGHTGCYLWPDLHLPEGFMILFPAIMLLGFVLVIRGTITGKKVDRLLMVWFAVVVLIVPLISKHRMEWRVWGVAYPSPPHYLDALFPLPYLFAARLIAGLRRRRLTVCLIPFVLLAIGLENLSFMRVRLIPAFSDPVVAGRWFSGIHELIAHTRKESQAGSPIFVSYMFGAGFPQLQFLIPDREIVPVLEAPTGWYDTTGKLQSGSALFVVRNGRIAAALASELPLFTSGSAEHPVWSLYGYKTPEIVFDGTITNAAGKEYRINLELKDQQGLLRIENDDWQFEGSDQLTRKDILEPYPGLDANNYALTPRHLRTFSLLNRRYSGSLITGPTWKLALIPGSPASLSFTNLEGLTLSGYVSAGSLMVR